MFFCAVSRKPQVAALLQPLVPPTCDHEHLAGLPVPRRGVMRDMDFLAARAGYRIELFRLLYGDSNGNGYAMNGRETDNTVPRLSFDLSFE